MKLRLLWTLLVAISSPPGHAASILTDVTPSNIAKQPLVLRVESEAHEDGTIAFDVFVSSGRDRISPLREGRFEIAREVIKQRVVGMALPPPAVWCSVREIDEDGVLRFSFGLPREMVPRATFQYRDYDEGGMPSMTVYRILLEGFAPAR